MKHIKKFNESNGIKNIFEDENVLHEILLELKDEGFSYTVKYKLFQYSENIDYYYMPIKTSEEI